MPETEDWPSRWRIDPLSRQHWNSSRWENASSHATRSWRSLSGSPLGLSGRDGWWWRGGSGQKLKLLWKKEKFREFPFWQVLISNFLLSFSFREFAINVACFLCYQWVFSCFLIFALKVNLLAFTTKKFCFRSSKKIFYSLLNDLQIRGMILFFLP